MKNTIYNYQLPSREMDVLNVMWAAGKPLLASEIISDELKISTVYTALKSLLAKKLIEVVSFTKSNTTFARCYQPTMTSEEFELDNLACFFRQYRKLTISDFVDALLKDENSETTQKELDELEQLIMRKREELGKQNK